MKTVNPDIAHINQKNLLTIRDEKVCDAAILHNLGNYSAYQSVAYSVFSGGI